MKLVGVLLAAGNSSRFGSNKLAYPLSDTETIGITSARKLISVLDECTAVVRENDTVFIEQLTRLGFNTVFQPHPEAGMGNSLARAIRANREADGWLVTLADMPWIKSRTLNAIVAAMKSGAAICAPQYNGQRGHPVGFSQRYRERLLALKGDAGARSLLLTDAELLQLVSVDDAGVLRDIDTHDDLISVHD